MYVKRVGFHFSYKSYTLGGSDRAMIYILKSFLSSSERLA